MALLIAGVLLWSLVHFIPAAATGLRGKLMGSLGEGPYKGVFSLALVASLVLIVVGWRSTLPTAVFTPPAFTMHLMPLFMIVVFFLLGAANAPGNVKRFIRHPMLAGFALWGAAHLSANGDDRSVVLFGGLALWALVMMPLLNKRDGAAEKPDSLPLSADLKILAIAVVFFVILFVLHPYFTGVSPLPK